MPKVSFVVPCYNMAQWLPVAVESCLYQSDPEIEVIIVNDGSTDASGMIADRYAATDKRVHVVHQQNQGHGPARMKGQELATGEFIHWLDADDFLDRQAVRDMYTKAKTDGVDAVCGNAVAFSQTTFNTRRYFYHPEMSGLTFETAPRYWKSKVMWRWFYRLETINALGVKHSPYKLGQDVCFNYEVLPKLKSFSQCGSFFYYFRQDHKPNPYPVELLVEHEIGHFTEIKQILTKQHMVKPLVKYLQENFYRDTKALAQRMHSEHERWCHRWLELGFAIFDGLEPDFFTPKYLKPELKCDESFTPLAVALINKNAQGALEIFNSLAQRRISMPDKSNAFHTWRRKIKSKLKPLSFRARFKESQLARLVRRRLKESPA